MFRYAIDLFSYKTLMRFLYLHLHSLYLCNVNFIDGCLRAELFFVSLTNLFIFCDNLQNNLHVSVSALVAAAVVWMSELPARLNPIILPLMASIKREQVSTSFI